MSDIILIILLRLYNYSLSVFENRICCKSKEYDPERTQPMADDQEKLMEELEQLKKAARQECLSHSPCPQVAEWLPVYSRWIDRKLCDEVELGLQYTSEYKEHRNVRLRELLHAARRRTAILHQQLDLLQQGAEAYDTAVDYLEMVGGGRRYVPCTFRYCRILTTLLRVNKIEFRRLYGF